MLLALAIILVIAWGLGFAIFHVASAGIHVLVILALLSLIAHLVRSAARKT